MSEEKTKDLDQSRSFEERVFARFDAIDSFLHSLNDRIRILESKTYDTKPIWERALKEILDTREKLDQTERELGERLSQIERGVKEELSETKRELKELKRQVAKRLDQIQAGQLSTRPDIREIGERLAKPDSTPAYH